MMMMMTRARQAAQVEEARSAASARVFACGPFVALLLAKLDAYALARFSAVNKAARDEVRANVDAQKLLEEFEEELEEKWYAMHAADSCPWGWCKGNLHLHNNVLCIPSKGTYGISWAFTMSRRMLIDQHGVDIWIRDELGQEVVNFNELSATPTRTIQPTDRYFDDELEMMREDDEDDHHLLFRAYNDDESSEDEESSEDDDDDEDNDE